MVTNGLLGFATILSFDKNRGTGLVSYDHDLPVRLLNKGKLLY